MIFANMMRSLLVVTSLLLVTSCFALARIVDGPGTSSPDIARALCRESSTARIASAETVHQLLSHFKSLQPESELYNCRKHYERPLEALQVVVDTSKDNVCTKDKVEVMANFHWDYIVPALSPRWIKASVEPIAPEPLRLFFMHYAEQVAIKCKNLLLERLTEATATSQQVADRGKIHKPGFHVSIYGMITELMPSRKITNYDSFTLLWSQLMGKERMRGHYYELYTDPVTDEKVVGLIKTQDAGEAWGVQAHCRNDLRPIYQNTVLPVMQLIEMGYGAVGRETKELVSGSQLLKDWYEMTQVCEALLPIAFYEDSTMREGKTVLLRRAEQTQGLRRQADVRLAGEIVAYKEAKPITVDGLVELADDSGVAQQIKKNIDKRHRSLKQVLKNVFNMMTTKLASKIKNFFLRGSKKDEPGDEFMKRSELEIKSEIEAFDHDVVQHETGRVVKVNDVSAVAKIQNRKLSTTAEIFFVVLMLIGACITGACAFIVIMG